MDFYNDIEMHRRMVGDEVRTRAFFDSIRATVKPGDVVLDVGAGSGILSMFAAQAGAARIYAIERAPGAAALARQMLVENGMADRVHVIEADVKDAPDLEPVDVIVSEWLGAYGVDESMLSPVLLARDRWLKTGGKMIPGETKAWLAPVFNEAGSEATAFQGRPYGLNLRTLSPYSADEAVWLPEGAREEDLRAEPQELWTTLPTEMETREAIQPYAAQLSFSIDGPVNGLAAWFTAELPGAGVLTNRPGAPATHWGNFLFPVVGPAAARASDPLEVGFHCVPIPGGGCHHLWSARVDNGPMEVHDTRRVARPAAAPPWRIYLGRGEGGSPGATAPPPRTSPTD